MDAFTFEARMDSKGRVTVPSDIRNRIDLEEDQKLVLALPETRVIRKQVSRQEALRIVDRMDAEEFSYSQGVLEVVVRD